MGLTKKRAIELTLELWEWLYEHPGKLKEHWPEWEYNGGQHPRVDTDCFCCEYAFQIKGPGCKACPLLPLWPATCMGGDSIYIEWRLSISVENNGSCKNYAKQIVDFCKKELQNEG